MKNYKFLNITLGIIAILVIFIWWISPQNRDPPNTIQSAKNSPLTPQNPKQANTSTHEYSKFQSQSQQDTEIDCHLTLDKVSNIIVNEHVSNCFEYFITQYGEKKISQINHNFKSYIQQNYKSPALMQILNLWSRYLQYRTELQNIEQPNMKMDDPEYHYAVFNSKQNLRKQFFSYTEIKGLFGENDTYDLYTIQRMKIYANKQLNEQEKAKKLQELFKELPEHWQKNLEQLTKLDDLQKLTATIKARGGSPKEIQQMRLNLVGAAATKRLENLDTQQEIWKNKVNQYLAERDLIMKNKMQTIAKEKALRQLRVKHFDQSKEQLRIQTFEHIHDQGGKLPFYD